MKVTPIPCLNDNYAYLITCTETGETAVVDPSESAPVIQALRKEGLTPSAIFNTHHHWDHIGGNLDLIKAFPNLNVYGHKSDEKRIDGQNQKLDHGDTVKLGNLEAKVLFNPGHTSGAISYHIEDSVFTGDTLFGAGCGRLFEGNPKMMNNSLNTVLASLPKETKVYFGHEYTQANLLFAITVEPENKAIREKMAKVDKAMKNGEFTTPSTIAEELEINPFMRVQTDSVKAHVAMTHPDNDLSPEEVFRIIRDEKNVF